MLSSLLQPRYSLKHIDRLVFTKHLSTMVKSGIPIAEAVATLIQQASNRTLKKNLAKVLQDVQNGMTLSKALGKYPGMFDHFYLSLIEVGEESGRLEENLDFLADHLAKDYALRKKIQGALLYPGLVFFAATGIAVFIGLFLLPQLLDFFESFEIELPLTTRILLWLAEYMRDFGIVTFIGIGASMVAFLGLVQLPGIKMVWHRVILYTPIFGKLMRYNQLARFARNLGMLLQSGLPAARALEATSKTLSNVMFQRDLVIITEALRKGTRIGVALEKHAQAEFPPIVTKMVSVGEKTGNLETTLLYLGDFFEDEIDSITKNMTTILEPALLLVIGLMVGFLALAVITPIYELTGSIRRG